MVEKEEFTALDNAGAHQIPASPQIGRKDFTAMMPEIMKFGKNEAATNAPKKVGGGGIWGGTKSSAFQDPGCCLCVC